MKDELSCEICCSKRISFEGVIDSNRVNNPANPYPFGQSNISISYNKCEDCKFLFSRDWASNSASFFEEKIYNADYKNIVDPDWTENRALQIAPLFGRLLNILKKTVKSSVLDYGGGNGLLALLLRENGYSSAVSYDPYTKDNQPPEETEYNVIIAVEVFEHEIFPQRLIKNLDHLLSNDGFIFFTTKTFRNPTLKDSYVAPRNGHISIFSQKALCELGSQRGFYYQPLAGGLLHCYSRKKLSFSDLISLNSAVAYEKASLVVGRLVNRFFGVRHE